MMDPTFPSASPAPVGAAVGGLGGAEHLMGLGHLAPVAAGVCDPHLNGLSLAEMIDHDIKADFDEVLRNNPLEFSNVDSLLSELGTGDGGIFKVDGPQGGASLAPSGGAGSQLHEWSGGGVNAADTHAFVSTLQGVAWDPNYVEDMGGASAVMVNPNNVMPVATSAQQLHLQQPRQQQQQPSLQHQQIQRLSVNTYSPSSSPQPSHPSPGFVSHSPVSLPQLPAQRAASAVSVQGGHQVFSVQVPSPVGGPGTARAAKTMKVLPPASSPMQQVPGSPLGQNSGRKKNPSASSKTEKENGFPKPAYSYSCLIALALKNSHTGSMSVSEIYKFMCEHFPYFKTAPSGWKNSVRHNLSLNKCFEKIEKPQTSSNQRKGCLWTMNPAKKTKMDEEVQKWSRKDPMAIKKGMAMPHTLESLERGEMVKDYNANSTSSVGGGGGGGGGAESEDEEDPRTPTSVSSSQGYDSAGSDFVDIETFSAIPDSALPELNLQAAGGVYEELKSDGGGSGGGGQTHSPMVNGTGPRVISRVAPVGAGHNSSVFFSTSIQGNYAIAPAAATGGAVTVANAKFNTLVQK